MPDIVRAGSPRVVVGVHGSFTSLSALRIALNQACDRNAILVPVLAWTPVGGELAYRRAPCPELLHLWRQAATQRMADAFDQALGGYPTEVEIQAQIVRGAAGTALVQTASGDGDLLVVGAGHRRLRQRRLSGPTARYCLTHARCPVILVPPPELLLHTTTLGQRRWMNRELPGTAT
jgi:nucleotide-binding universal stress UspA family protein